VLRHLTMKMDAAISTPSPMMREEKPRFAEAQPEAKAEAAAEAPVAQEAAA
jgi:small subunit ribosomal protein S6